MINFSDSSYTKKPDFDHLKDVLLNRAGGPVPLMELRVDAEILTRLLNSDFPAERYLEILDGLSRRNPLEEHISLAVRLMDMMVEYAGVFGYDSVMSITLIPVRRTPNRIIDSPMQLGLKRQWKEEHSGIISSRADLDAYQWPAPDMINILPSAYMAGKMQRGMKVVAMIEGIFELLCALMGFETAAVKSIEEPDLVDDILTKLADIVAAAVEKSAAFEGVGAIFYCDDIAHTSSTMLSPGWLREFVFHRTRRFAEIAHAYGKPFIYHSCGKIESVMEDLIEDVKIDARHSFQDHVEPVEEFYAKYGGRIAVIGGLDVDILARGTETEVRERVRKILKSCNRGGYCMGSGNSVTNYCKPQNVLAMIDETLRWNAANI
jgi:uroporphyrinogen decarboxylase